KGYLWPRHRDRNGLREDEVEISDDVLRTIIGEYTREAGVRNLERELGTVLRKTATKIASAQSQVEPETERTASKPVAESADTAAKSNGKLSDAAEHDVAKMPKKKAKAAKPTPVKIDVDAVRDALGRQKVFQESAAR